MCVENGKAEGKEQHTARSCSPGWNFPLMQKQLCSHPIFLNIPLKPYLTGLLSLYYCPSSFTALIWKISPPQLPLPGFLVIPPPPGFWFPLKMLSITNDCVLAKCCKYILFLTFSVALSPFWNSILLAWHLWFNLPYPSTKQRLLWPPHRSLYPPHLSASP